MAVFLARYRVIHFCKQVVMAGNMKHNVTKKYTFI